jgi:radical SAM protein with 4Fe4S-binding SPASM domain
MQYELLRSAKSAKLRINATITMTDDMSPTELAALSSRIKPFVDIVRINKALPQIKAPIYYNIDALKEFKYYSKCYASGNAITINSTGNVYACCQTAAEEFSSHQIGSILRTPLQKIWLGAKHRRFMQSFDPNMVNCRCTYADQLFNEICHVCAAAIPAACAHR